MTCDACGSKVGNSWMSYHGIFSRDKKSLVKFIAKKSGKQKSGNDFELCGTCSEEWKKTFSQELKEEIIKKLTVRKSVDCWADFAGYFSQKYLQENDWEKAKKALAENIKRYKNEWEIREMDWNRDRQYYYDKVGDQRKINKQTILRHQSAPIEYSSNDFLLIEPPKMYRKDYFSPHPMNRNWKNFKSKASNNRKLVANQTDFNHHGNNIPNNRNDNFIDLLSQKKSKN